MTFLDRVIGPGDRDAFAAEVVRRFARAHPDETPTYDAAEFLIRLGKDGAVVNLHNVWAQVEHASRPARAAAARKFVATFVASRRTPIPDRWEDAAPLLMPKIRPRVWYPLLDLRARVQKVEALSIAHETLGEHYAVELVCDFPETCSSVPEEKLAAWGKTFAEAMMTATRNLRGRPFQVRTEYEDERHVGSRAVLVMTADAYDASRVVVIDAVFKQIGARFDPVVLPVHRDVLICADPEDSGSLSLLAAVGAREFDKPYGNACVPLRRSFGEWTPWLPPTGHPAHDALATLVRRSIERDYADQAEALQAAEGDDVYVANHLLVNKGKPDEHVVVAWTDGVRSWLPHANRVAMGRLRADGKHDLLADVPWGVLVEIAGGSMKPLDMWPRRWEVRDFPDAATMERLVAASTEI